MLDVWLGDLHVGVLVREEPLNVLSFVLDESYLSMVDRPVLGQQFEERRTHRRFRQAASPGQLPAFFANLLPEGALQAMVTAQFAPADAAATLAIVGEDLPGAVVVRPAIGEASVPLRVKTFDEPSAPDAVVTDGLRFSLAGVQLKFSAVEGDDLRFTLPFRGLGGRWILKFGSKVFPNLPENECAIMDWAAASGLHVPVHRLVSTRDIDGLDPRFAALGDQVFAIQRYDRRVDGTRVHQEDFAQVRGVPPWGITSTPVPAWRRWRASSVTCAAPRIWRSSCAACCSCCCAATRMLTSRTGRSSTRTVTPPGWEHVSRVEKYLREHGHVTDLDKVGRTFVERSLDAWSVQRNRAHPAVRDAIDAHLGRSPLVPHLD